MATLHDATSDEELARAARDGDRCAFEELVTRYEKRVFHFFRCRTRHDADAEDLTQQLFVKLYRGLERFNPNRKLAPWLFAIAHRCAVSHYRSRAVHIGLPEPGEVAVDARAPDTLLAAQETADDLWAWAQSKLTPGQFTVLWLRIQEEMPIRDVARATGHTVASVKVLLHRARARLVKAGAQTRAGADCRADLRSAVHAADLGRWPAATPLERGTL